MKNSAEPKDLADPAGRTGPRRRSGPSPSVADLPAELGARRRDSVPAAVGRVQLFVEAVAARPIFRWRLRAWWATLVDQVDITTLLADFGFAPRTALVSEIAERLRAKLLPGGPETIDASELFMLAMPSAFDAQWLAALDEATLNRLVMLLAQDNADGALAAPRAGTRRCSMPSPTAQGRFSTGFAPNCGCA